MTYIQAITNFLTLTLRSIFIKIRLLKGDVVPRNSEIVGLLPLKETTCCRCCCSARQSVVVCTANVVTQSPLYVRLVRGLREKDETIDVLNRRLAFLNGEIKLKDLRIANLLGQVANFFEIGLQRTRPYVPGSKLLTLKPKMPFRGY